MKTEKHSVKRQKIEDRVDFLTESQKHALWQKSDGLCAHCGKKTYFHYGATVEHVIPLQKGGTNEWNNLVMLCEKCNQEKKSRIYAPETYLTYLKDEEKEKITERFEEFINSFEYISRGNLLACDDYLMRTIPYNLGNIHHHVKNKKKLEKIMRRATPEYHITRAYPEDLGKVTDFFVNYLKRFEFLENEETARKNIEFWYRFGCIYYIQKNDEIYVMMPIVISDLGMSDHKPCGISMYIFSKYASEAIRAAVKRTLFFIPETMALEHDLPYMEVNYAVLKKDPISKWLPAGRTTSSNTSPFMEQYGLVRNPMNEETDDIDFDELTKEQETFFSNFQNIKDEMDEFFKDEDRMETKWMGSEIIAGYGLEDAKKSDKTKEGTPESDA